MKAVVWTDVFQGLVMLGGLLTVLGKVCHARLFSFKSSIYQSADVLTYE